MLISEPMINRVDPIFAMIAGMSGRSAKATELRTGVYEIGHFGSSNFLDGYEDYPDTTVGSYGVCDNMEQLLEKCPELDGDADRQFVVALTKIRKADQEPEGGWRWHKWGGYIGDQDPQCEYLYDEPEIDEVFVYHIYEKV